MQNNDIRITLKTLFTLGNIDSLKKLRDTLKGDYEYAESLLNLNDEVVKDLNVEVVKEQKPQSQHSLKPLVYNKDWSNQEKFIFVLKNNNRFSKFREVAERIIEIEGKGDVDYLTRRLTASTRNLKLDGKIVKIAVGGHRNTFWGLSKWQNEDGSIKEGHEYLKENIATSRNRNKRESSGILDDL